MKNKTDDTLQKFISTSLSLSMRDKQMLLSKLPSLTGEQKAALQRVFEEEKKEYESIEKKEVAAWKAFATNLGIVNSEINQKLP